MWNNVHMWTNIQTRYTNVNEIFVPKKMSKIYS